MQKITVESREPSEALGVAGQNLLVWSATKGEKAAQANEAAVAPPAKTHQYIFRATHLRPRRNKGRAYHVLCVFERTRLFQNVTPNVANRLCSTADVGYHLRDHRILVLSTSSTVLLLRMLPPHPAERVIVAVCTCLSQLGGSEN